MRETGSFPGSRAARAHTLLLPFLTRACALFCSAPAPRPAQVLPPVCLLHARSVEPDEDARHAPGLPGDADGGGRRRRRREPAQGGRAAAGRGQERRQQRLLALAEVALHHPAEPLRLWHGAFSCRGGKGGRGPSLGWMGSAGRAGGVGMGDSARGAHLSFKFLKMTFSITVPGRTYEHCIRLQIHLHTLIPPFVTLLTHWTR